MAFPLPDKPSIAVLPFDNFSDDPEQEYFSDGITDDLITDLSKVSGLFVVARNSTFSYKGKHQKVQQIAEDLGVRYVLEGSVRKHENKIRINAQLIDAIAGGHLWAERYDRDFKEIFALQDEIIKKIVSALSVKLTGTEKERIGGQKTDSIAAYDYYLKGMSIVHDISGPNLLMSKEMFELAIKHDPNFAHAYAAHALANYFIYRFGYWDAGIDPKDAIKQAFEDVKKALNINPHLSTVYTVLGNLELVKRNFDKAVEYSQRAVSLDPNDPEGYVVLGYILSKVGEHQKGLETIQIAFRLNPKPPHYYYFYLGHVQLNNRLYEKAIESIKKGAPDTPLTWRIELLVSYVYLNQMEEAKAQFDKIRQSWSSVNFDAIRRALLFKKKEDEAHFFEAYRKVEIQ
jgi:TolB-like protein/Tfp pilus assembly protein PilF